ncbi:hypothetical protein BsWGS_20575 [Bradybaena similaris]
MANILFTVCLSFIAVLQLETSSAQQIGVCVEMCSSDPEDPYGFGVCEDGYVCKSNGCGHTCQLVVPEKKSELGACVISCSSGTNNLDLPGCAEGYECRFNGCGQTCQHVVAEKKSQMGACVETCSLVPNILGLPGCAEGYECRSNGCGHTCQLAALEKKAEFGSCIEACSPALNLLGLPECPEGYVCRSNGCGHTCQLGTEVVKRQRCGLVLCDLVCEQGFALDEHGCETCMCRE